MSEDCLFKDVGLVQEEEDRDVFRCVMVDDALENMKGLRHLILQKSYLEAKLAAASEEIIYRIKIFCQVLTISVQIDNIDQIIRLLSHAVHPFLSAGTRSTDIIHVESKGLKLDSGFVDAIGLDVHTEVGDMRMGCFAPENINQVVHYARSESAGHDTQELRSPLTRECC